MADLATPEAAVLIKARHVKYWLRCLKTLLPHHYTGNDSNRMYLAFLILCALDLLSALDTALTPEERRSYTDWIYHCQHPNGGFRMWPGTDFGPLANEGNAAWDPANLPATYFALTSLIILNDDLGRVKRGPTLAWLRTLQRADDGSFGETSVNGHIEGGRDPRFAYCATGVRYILRGWLGEDPAKVKAAEVGDIDIDRLVHYVREAESYDGGIADEKFREPHAGYTYCALGTLAFTNRLNSADSRPHIRPSDTAKFAPADPQTTLRWLVARQTDMIVPEDESLEAEMDPDIEGARGDVTKDSEQDTSSPRPSPPLHQSPDPSSVLSSPLAMLSHPCTAGMNGRCNKVADTCYAWWTCGSLYLLGQPGLFDREALRSYLLGQTQHVYLGGFGKFPGDLPDVYHSCLGLAVLGLIGDSDIKPVEPGMCISKDAKAKLVKLWDGWR